MCRTCGNDRLEDWEVADRREAIVYELYAMEGVFTRRELSFKVPWCCGKIRQATNVVIREMVAKGEVVVVQRRRKPYTYRLS